THLIRARNIENSGSVVASSGLISINSETMKVAGVPPITNVTFAFNFTNFGSTLVTNIVGAKLQSSSDIEIIANDLVMSNAVFQTGANGGGLDLSIANRLSDSGLDAVSTWLIGGS